MDIGTPLRALGEIDSTALRNAILSQADTAWHEHEYRQQKYEVHRLTESIVLVFTDGSNWPNCEVRKQPGWHRLSDVAIPLMHRIIDKHYPRGGTIIRAMAAKLLAGGRIDPHHDQHPSFHCSHRIHVPITSNPRVRLMIEGRPYALKTGEVYELNNQKQHSVMNKGSEDRITFIFDYVPPGPLAVGNRSSGQ